MLIFFITTTDAIGFKPVQLDLPSFAVDIFHNRNAFPLTLMDFTSIRIGAI
jgi:hypothetical protein